MYYLIKSYPYPSLNGTAEYYELGSKLDEVKENYWKNGIDTDKVPYKKYYADYLKQDVELTEKVMYKQMERINESSSYETIDIFT